MLGVFSEFERAMIRSDGGTGSGAIIGKRLGRPRTTRFQVQRIHAALDEGRGVRGDGSATEGERRQGERDQAHDWVRNNVLEFTKGIPESMIGNALIAEVK